MSHFYATKAKTPSLVEDVQTPAKAKKIEGMYPSVTTVLSILKDDFLHGIWMPKKITEIARDNPNIGYEEVVELTFGLREHPESGAMIPSSSFGVCTHKRIEEILEETEETVLDAFTPWAEPFINWLDEQAVTTLATEYIIVDHDLKIAGSIDFIGKDKDGKIFLADYKCRSTSGRGKFYDKDCQQLAVESRAVRKEKNLDYDPEIISVCICTESKKHYHKKWNEKDYKKHLRTAELCAELYWNSKMQ
jgi:hypothetical protein|tara:strand:+ start:1113 stop:1856 length:744 start_codon:yes stop_codon:yes gene_type:complete